jgi:hypothetical protein
MALTMIYEGGPRGEAVEPCEYCGSHDLNMTATRTGERFKRAIVYQFEATCPNGHLRLILPRMTLVNARPSYNKNAHNHAAY